MTKCNSKNACMGNYGNCVDIKITNQCNCACEFCIEKGGYSPKETTVDNLIDTVVNTLFEYENVLILGGEPLTHKHLEEFLKGIKPFKKGIYLTTNGLLLDEQMATMLSNYLTAINISVHHYTEEKNNAVYKNKIDFKEIKKAICILESKGIKVRINCNLVKGFIDTKIEANKMIEFAKTMGVSSIRFSELQGNSNLFVFAKDLFSDLASVEPFSQGCEQQIKDNSIEIKVKLTCGEIDKKKQAVISPQPATQNTKVVYPSAEIFEAWQKEIEKLLQNFRVTQSNACSDCHSRSSSGHCGSSTNNSCDCHSRSPSRGHC